MAGRSWTLRDDRFLVSLRERKRASWVTIGLRMDRTAMACEVRYGHLKRNGIAQGVTSPEVEPEPIRSVAEIEADKFARAGLDGRFADRNMRLAVLAQRDDDLRRGHVTASFFGDPPRGFSALDGKTGMT